MSFLGAVGGALGGLFGGGSSDPKVNYTPPGFNSGGLTASFQNGAYNVSPNADRTALVTGVSNTFGQQANDLASLRGTVTPGYSQLRQTALADLQNNRTAAIGNLQQNLAQRRILGSSFASDAIARSDMEFEQQRQKTIANSFLEELQANQTLIQQQYTAARGQFQTGLDELNLEAGLASDLTGKASSALENASAVQAKLDADAAAGRGKFFAQLGTGIGNFFGSGAAGSGIDAGLNGLQALGFAI